MLGGDGACWSEPGWSRPWTFGVQDPRDTVSRKVLLRLRATGGAVVTSGGYYRYHEIAGRRYSHVLDPRTGRPVETAVASATVIHREGAAADALATACMVLGARDGIALLTRLAQSPAGRGEAEGLILESRDGRLVRRATPGFAAYEAP